MQFISPSQFELVHNILTLAMTAMGGGALFFFLQRGEVAQRYRVVVALAAVVTAIATFNYAMLAES
jgi:hypothetical protein